MTPRERSVVLGLTMAFFIVVAWVGTDLVSGRPFELRTALVLFYGCLIGWFNRGMFGPKP